MVQISLSKLTKTACKLKNAAGKGRFLTGFIVLLVFFFHFTIANLYSLPGIQNNTVNVIIEYLRMLLAQPGFAPWTAQINFYTGNPFFLLPVFNLFGSSPQTLRYALIGIMAFSSSVAFLLYTALYDLRKGLIGLLLLFNMETWLVFRDGDYTYSVLFPLLLIYTFTAWYVSDRDYMLYVSAFLAGFLAYFKLIVGYAVIALGFAKLASDREKLLDDLDAKKMVLSGVFGIIGATPLLYYIYQRDFVPVRNVLEPSKYGGETKPLIDVFYSRVTDLSHVISPREFYNVPACLQCLDINIFVILLLAGIGVSLYRRRRLFPTTLFLSMFTLLLYVPNVERWMQIMVLPPLIPPVMLALVETVPERLQKGTELVVMVMLVIGFATSLHALDEKSRAEFEEELTHWGGTQDAYREYAEISTGSKIVTNSYEIWILSRYDFEKESKLLMTPEMDQLKKPHRSMWRNLLRKGHVTIKQVNKDGNATYIIDQTLDCPEGVNECGYSMEKLKQELELDRYPQRYITVNGRNYTVYN